MFKVFCNGFFILQGHKIIYYDTPYKPLKFLLVKKIPIYLKWKEKFSSKFLIIWTNNLRRTDFYILGDIQVKSNNTCSSPFDKIK